ncbi:hypothetical protein M1N56_08330 [Dehalococcoidia bacterium]|nr:hypothetical protein [Dehalococcoidia bacterium]
MSIATHFTDGPPEEAYNHVVKTLEDKGFGSPTGREYHFAYREADGTITVLDIWDSEESLGKFAEQLMPIFEELGVPLSEPKIYEVANIIVGK